MDNSLKARRIKIKLKVVGVAQKRKTGKEVRSFNGCPRSSLEDK